MNDAPVETMPREQILAFLRDRGPVQAWQVAQHVEGDLEPVSAHLRAMTRDGMVKRDKTSGRTLWSAVTMPPPRPSPPVAPGAGRGEGDEEPDLPPATIEPEIVEATAEPLPDPVEPPRGPTLRGDPPPTALTLRHTIRDLVLVFAESERKIRASFAEMVAVQNLLADAFGGAMHIEAGSYGGHNTSFVNPDNTMESLRRHAWQHIAEKLEIRRAMSIRAAEELDERLGVKRGSRTIERMPELTEANVWEFFTPYAVSMESMFAEAMQEVFNWLRPTKGWGVEYKTNQKNGTLELGERLIVCGGVSSGYGSRWRLSEHVEKRFLALENVFSLLDGQGGIAKTYRGAVSDAVAATKTNDFDAGLYFKGRVFKRGTLHLVFKRPDLLGEFNRRAGGMNFRAGPEAESIADLIGELDRGLCEAGLTLEAQTFVLAARALGTLREVSDLGRELVRKHDLTGRLWPDVVRRVGLEPTDEPAADEEDAFEEEAA